jgi:hypothetical protein
MEPPHDFTMLAARHRRIGWVTLAVFVALGLALETLHAWKARLYLDVGHEERRLMWTLAHAHGTLLGLVHLGFASTLAHITSPSRAITVASRALVAATLLLPGGFFLGGFGMAGGDPGPAALVIPLGGAALLVAATVTAWTIVRR